MKTYSTIKAEIAELQKQAEALRKTEVAGVVAKIKEAIAAYALTAADLGLGRGAAKPAKPALTSTAKNNKTRTVTIGVPKYRDPKSGKTWTGRGKPPAWIVGAKDRDRYLIDAQAADAGGEALPEPSANGTHNARIAAQVRGKAKKAPTKKVRRIGRKTKSTPVKTPAVQMESGVASQ